MKATSLVHRATGLFVIALLVLGISLVPQRSQAQGGLYPDAVYSREELAQMLAPIALYPDALLSQILMASTYPIEVIEADRWRRNNPHLLDEALDVALTAADWDPSVKALCHFPSILALMSERIDETTNLGNAFLAQEGEVLGMVQELRAAAYAQGNLTTTSRQQVIVERETIIIQPANPRYIYVPYYDPFTIYGPWWYPAYPPYYWVPSGVSLGFGLAYWPGIYFSFSFGNWSYFDWHRHYIFIDSHKRPRFVRHNRWLAKHGHWQHAPRHRRGVAYRDRSTALKYGQPHSVVQTRRDIRGVPERRAPARSRFGDLRRPQERQRVESQRAVSETQIRQRLDRSRQQPTRIEPNRSVRQQIERQRTAPENLVGRRLDRGRQQPIRIEPSRSVRSRAEFQRQQREQVSRDVRARQRSDRGRQMREGAERHRPKQVRSERARPTRQPAVGNRPRQQRPDLATQQPQVERRQQQRSRDNVVNRADKGPRERHSNERSRGAGQDRDGDFRGRGSRYGRH